MRLGILTSHPIQYQAPWFRALAKEVDLEVFFAHRQTSAEQGRAGFGVAFDWDVDLLSGYQHRFLKNVSRNPGADHFSGCDTPEIADIISGKLKSGNLKAEISDSNFSIPASQHVSVSPFDAFIVCGWYLKSYLQAVRACRAAGVPVLVRGDSQLRTPRPLLKRLAMEVRQRWLLRKLDGFLSVGIRHREYLEHFGVPPKKIFLAPHFVDNEWFAARAAEVRADATLAHRMGEGQGVRALGEVSNASPSSQLPTSISALRKQWGADEETFVALFVGKFIEKKRPADLLQALGRISSAGRADLPVDQDAQLLVPAMLVVFVGSGELEKELRELATRENLRTHFVGFKNQSELPAIYTAADVLVLPSDGGETWGLVVNEAMACGLPAVVSDAVGCGPDLIENGKTGFTFPVGDVPALGQRLHQIAAMRNKGHDFRPALAEKLLAYSVEAAVRGTIQAAEKLKR